MSKFWASLWVSLLVDFLLDEDQKFFSQLCIFIAHRILLKAIRCRASSASCSVRRAHGWGRNPGKVRPTALQPCGVWRKRRQECEEGKGNRQKYRYYYICVELLKNDMFKVFRHSYHDRGVTETIRSFVYYLFNFNYSLDTRRSAQLEAVGPVILVHKLTRFSSKYSWLI